MRLRICFAAGVLSVVTSLAWSQDCYKSAILSPVPFSGTYGEIFKLIDGSLWEVKDAMNGMNMCEYNPDVMICPSRGKIIIRGNMLKVEQARKRKSEPASRGIKASSAK